MRQINVKKGMPTDLSGQGIDSEDLKYRRNAEIEFVSAAYGLEEAWCGHNSNGLTEIHRRIELPFDGGKCLALILTLSMPLGYPESEGLDISCTLHETLSEVSLARKAYKAIPKLVEYCRKEIIPGEESVLLVLNRADKWVQDYWAAYCRDSEPDRHLLPICSVGPSMVTLGRRLIYSHHIISKTKCRNLKLLASRNNLTGFLRIGWPGLILIEGAEVDCVEFYDEIRRWSWKFLELRGEQQERVKQVGESRKFKAFTETHDVSLIAQCCREAGLEALFMTYIKVNSNIASTDDRGSPLHGILVHLDHMNHKKGYHKWLRKVAKDSGCLLTLKQSFPRDDFSKRPLIIVVVVGESESIQELLKRWRTSRVDVDSKGKPCLERMMTVLTEGPVVDGNVISSIDWDGDQGGQAVNTSMEELNRLVSSIGGDLWKQSLESLRI